MRLLYAVLLAVLCANAQAAQITLGNNDPTLGQLQFSNIGGGDVGVQTINGSLVGASEAFYQSDVGSYTLAPTSFNTLSPEVLGIFPTDGFQNLDITFASGAKLDGLINWTSLKDNSLTPEFLGLVHVTTCTPGADAALCNDFAVGSNDFIDFTVSPISTFLTQLTGSEIGDLSSGEIVPRAVPVNEPSTLSMLGIGIIAFWMLARGHIRTA